MATTFCKFTPDFVRNCCRTCGKSVPLTSRKALFSVTGKTARIPQRLSAIGQIDIKEGDGLPHFCCKQCVSRLDRLTPITAEAENIKQELSTNLMATTTCLDAAGCVGKLATLKYSHKGHYCCNCHKDHRSSKSYQRHHSSNSYQGHHGQQQLPRTPQQRTIHTSRMKSSTTPASAVRQPMRRGHVCATENHINVAECWACQ